MILPNYKNGSLVNLMSSIKRVFGGKHQYNELKNLKSKELKDYKNVVLLVIDGLGYNYIKSKKNTILKENLRSSITSVFPATTASVIPTFYSGYPPQQSGLTGWYMFLKEISATISTLKFKFRLQEKEGKDIGIDMKDVYNFKPFTEDLKCSSYHVKPAYLTSSKLSQMASKNAKLIGYTTLKGLMNQISKVVKSHNRKKYIYAYWDKFDSTEHKFGSKSKEAEKHYLEICDEIERLAKKLEGTNTKLIITADHGFVDNTKDRYTDVSLDHPDIKDCLTMPLCGDPRVAYAYVKPSKAKEFERLVKTKIKNCHLIKSKDAVKKNFFGLFKPNPKFLDRIGDYVIVMKENYAIRESSLNSNKGFKPGIHSGATPDEMYVPLIVMSFK